MVQVVLQASLLQGGLEAQSLEEQQTHGEGGGWGRGRLQQKLAATWIILIMSRGPTAPGSKWTWAFWVARATEAFRTPLVAISCVSMLWTQEEQVIPEI